MKILAVIPARAGSKRFPNKNTALLDGKPLVEHSIEYALQNTKFFHRTIVTSNDPEVIEICNRMGVDCFERPAEISTDKSPTSKAVKHVLENAEGHFDAIATLQPTNPLRPDGIVEKAVAILAQPNCDSVFSVYSNHRKMGFIRDGTFTPVNYSFGSRSQDMEELFFESGLFYLTRSELILKDQIFGPNLKPMLINHPFSEIDIDFEKELIKAEYYLKMYKDYAWD